MPDGRATTGKIDLYRRDRFVVEAKQTAASAGPANQVAEETTLELGLTHSAPAKRDRDPYGKAMIEARVQAERYAQPPRHRATATFSVARCSAYAVK